MRAARLATLALLLSQVGQDTISTVIPFSNGSVCRSQQVLQVENQVSMSIGEHFGGISPSARSAFDKPIPERHSFQICVALAWGTHYSMHGDVPFPVLTAGPRL